MKPVFAILLLCTAILLSARFSEALPYLEEVVDEFPSSVDGGAVWSIPYPSPYPTPHLPQGPHPATDDPVDDYSDNNLERLLQNAVEKRSCIHRGGSCDHRPSDCCYSSSCRCNLWGANCRCQRMGLFQKWGK